MTACVRCAAELAAQAKFCSECGTPQPAGRPVVAEERKVVTALFCDLVGFTAHSDNADPEDVRARIRPYHQRLRHEIERYGGTVEKFVGDAVMAVFGAPVAHEDDAERAVRAGLELLDAITDLNDADPDLALAVRIGIETGEAVVVLDARPELGEGFVTGDVVNTASRLQGVAPTGGIVIGPGTHRAVPEIFDLDEQPAAVLKGKAEPVAVWSVLGARGRLGVGVVRDHTVPMVGRELELMLLTGTFDRSVRDAALQLVTLVGEPGAGKSRLLAELGMAIDVRPELVRWRQGHCLSYGDGITFWALGEIVKAHAGILDSDDPARAQERLAAAVPADVADRDWLIARLRPLVGLEGVAGAAREEAFTAWRTFCESLAVDGPAVLVFEDLHWADDALLDFLEHLAEFSVGVPVLLVCTARPELVERRPTWGTGLRNATTINLAPLSDDEVGRLVEPLLADLDAAPEIRRSVVERAGGNPLYAEQFVRSLRADGVSADSLDRLPHSLAALVSARLDTLPPARKAVLQDASVLGAVFWTGAVAAMGDREVDAVQDHLHALARKELVRAARGSTMAGEREHTFWHALVRDVCYSQIPRAARAEKHRRAARWITGHAGRGGDDVADLLAHHWTQALTLDTAAGRPPDEDTRDQARRALLQAGDRAMALDVARAETLYVRALELLPAGHADRPSVLARRAAALHHGGRLGESEQAHEEAAASFRAVGDRAGAGGVLVELADILYLRGDPRFEDVLGQATALLEAEPPGAALVAAYAMTASAAVVGNRRHDAREWGERALRLAERLGEPPPGRVLAMLGLLRVERGERGGIDDIREAVRLFEAAGDFGRAGMFATNVAINTWLFDGPERGRRVIGETVESCVRRGTTTASLAAREVALELMVALGRWPEAVAAAGPLMGELVAAGAEVSHVAVRASLLRVLAQQGRADGREAGTAELVDFARASGEAQVVVYLFTAVAQARLAGGDRAGALALVTEIAGWPEVADDAMLQLTMPEIVRIALGAGDVELAARLADLPRSPLPQTDHARVAAAAAVAEARGDRAGACVAYADAAARWAVFGAVPEQVHALLGLARTTDDPGTARVALDTAAPLITQLDAPLLQAAAEVLSRTPSRTAAGVRSDE